MVRELQMSLVKQQLSGFLSAKSVLRIKGKSVENTDVEGLARHIMHNSYCFKLTKIQM